MATAAIPTVSGCKYNRSPTSLVSTLYSLCGIDTRSLCAADLLFWSCSWVCWVPQKGNFWV